MRALARLGLNHTALLALECDRDFWIGCMQYGVATFFRAGDAWLVMREKLV